ncbi:EpsG family protein [Cytobacillus sp. S13-E01]|uniref:EpsG family protein n=1 Tax=Cytobacillus sp. S13-E01 TaxID=3031326 RepID=UPI0023D7BA8A|nr:EpsG family protein [Cytobacillus sp. S13-E01]MDF0727771.1 EpsG family protein [Cytobacillus sp. S13-E01]
MTILWINLCAVFSFSLLARYFSKTTLIDSIPRPNKIFTLLVLILLVLVSGLRAGNIGDTGAYMHGFRIAKFNWNDVDFSGEFGFYIYQMLIKNITDDPQVLVFVSALITNLLIIYVFYKYSRYFELATYVYITSGLFLVSMNGIRQFLASAILFTATKFLIAGNWKKYFIVVIFASTFHKSALILIPVYFIVRRKAWSKTTLVLILMTIPFLMIFTFFTDTFFSLLEETRYGHYENFNEGGANVLRTLVSIVPIIIAYFGRHKLKEIYPQNDCIVNMALINTIVMLVATQNWIFARFTIYFGLYQVLLLSWVIKLFNKKDRKFIYYAILICYFVFFYYEHVVSLNIDYKSKFINL